MRKRDIAWYPQMCVIYAGAVEADDIIATDKRG